MSRLKQEIERNFNRNKDNGKVQDAHVLGFENVAFPYLALSIGIAVAFIQLGIEIVMFYKKKSAYNRDSEDASLSEEDNESRQIIKEISELLKRNNTKPKDMKLLSQIRNIAKSDVYKTTK